VTNPKQHICKNCMQLQKRIEQLETRNKILEYELKEMRSKWFSKKKKKSTDETEEEEELPKKRGAPIGHEGWFRKKPAKVDEIVDVTIDKCPQCGGEDLNQCEQTSEHTQEDIIMPKVKVTLYRHRTYWCADCKEVVVGVGKDEMPGSYIGPKAKALSGFLKYVVKVSQRDIRKIFQKLCGLTVVPSTVPGFHNQARRKGISLYEKLKQKIRKSTYVHADET